MNLKTEKDPQKILTLLLPFTAELRQENGNITELTLFKDGKPVLSLQKAGEHSKNLEVFVPATKTVFRSVTKLCGALVTKDFDDASSRESWEEETKNSISSSVELVFERSESVELA
jgi:hypothetical protein